MSQACDRYRAAGLTGNPFSVEMHDSDVGILPNAWFVDRGVPKPPPPGSKTLVQIIGDQGVGKSTHLHYWRHHQDGPYHYIPRSPYHLRWHRAPVADLVYGDEIDRMPRLLRRQWFGRLAERDATVVIGTHADLGRLGSQFGFVVRTHRLGLVDHDQMEAVLRLRIKAATVPDASTRFRFTDDDVAEILARSNGNLRAADTASHQLVARRLNRQTDSGPGSGLEPVQS